MDWGEGRSYFCRLSYSPARGGRAVRGQTTYSRSQAGGAESPRRGDRSDARRRGVSAAGGGEWRGQEARSSSQGGVQKKHSRHVGEHCSARWPHARTEQRQQRQQRQRVA